LTINAMKDGNCLLLQRRKVQFLDPGTDRQGFARTAPRPTVELEAKMKKLFLLVCLVAMLIPLTSATAADETSSFISSAWRLFDEYEASWHDVINTTNKNVYVDLIFFDENGNFCGCDTYEIAGYASLKFWTDDEWELGAIMDSCEYTTAGQLKVIGYTQAPIASNPLFGGNLIGFTTITHDGFDYTRNSAGMKALAMNQSEMGTLHMECSQYWVVENLQKTLGLYRKSTNAPSKNHGND